MRTWHRFNVEHNTAWNRNRAGILKFFAAQQDGFALPSILSLILILSLIALGLLTNVYLQKGTALRLLTRVRAEYAAHNGIIHALANINNLGELTQLSQPSFAHFSFEDGSEANIELKPWGAFLLATSRGRVRNSESVRTAIVAQQPGTSFDKTLIFANANHQLVLAGTSSIRGQIITGPDGVGIGHLRNTLTKSVLPRNADVRREARPILPPFDSTFILRQVNTFEVLLGTTPQSSVGRSLVVTNNSTAVTELRGENVADSIDHVFIQGNAVLGGLFSRTSSPLCIVVNGMVMFEKQAQLRGIITIVAERAITIPDSIRMELLILYSRSQIDVKKSAAISAQLIAPSITVDTNAVVDYPSTLIALPSHQTQNTGYGIHVRAGGKIEGTILAFGNAAAALKARLTIEPGATVVGAVYSRQAINLDGIVYGTVMTEDFYFYEEPTSYFGWLRTARIDHSSQHRGYLTPIGFSKNIQLDILEWL